MATRKRPAQGHHLPKKLPLPKYRQGMAPKVTSAGSVSHPKDTKWSLKGHDAPDQTPRIVQV